MHIAVDFDDVLYPYHFYLKQRLKRRFGIDLTKARVTTFYYDLLPEVRALGITREQVWTEVRAAWHETEDHEAAALLDPEAEHVLRTLGRRHRVSIVTARHGDALPTVKAFLARHRIRPNNIILDQHEKAGYDILIDDFPAHALENAKAGGHSLLYSIDENSTFDESRFPRIHRVASWRDVRDTITFLEEREAAGG